MEIGMEYVNSIPVFVVTGTDPIWSRVLGATQFKALKKWVFPAFPPFLDSVLYDFDKVNKRASFTTAAQEWLKRQRPFEEVLEFAHTVQTPGPYNSYAHQREGLAHILHNYRYGLEWEMGTGKTKTFIDAIQILKARVLVLAPVVALHTWVKEARVHSDNQLKTIILAGDSKQYRLRKYIKKNYDIVIASYGVARTSGVPKLYAAAQKKFHIANNVFPARLRTGLAKLNNEKEQARFAEEWVKGRELKEILEELKELITGPQWLSDLPYDMIIADEAHRIKNIRSKQTKACLRLARGAVRRYILSGTLSQGDPRDLYPQLKFLAPYALPGNWEDFCKEHVRVAPNNRHIVIGYKNLDRLNRRITKIVNKKTLDECIDLPPRQDIDVLFDLSPQQIKDYNYAVKECVVQIPGYDPLDVKKAHRINKLLQLCSGFVYIPTKTDVCDDCEKLEYCVCESIQPGDKKCIQDCEPRIVHRYKKNPKLIVTKEILESVLSKPSQKIIIWANMKAELEDIEQLLVKNKWGYVRVDGSNSKHISKFEEQFQNDKDCRVYLGQIRTGISVTLTAAAYMLYYSRSWLLDDWLQSRGRNRRIGQTKKMVVYRLVAKGSVETQQLSALDQRRDISATLTHKVNCAMCQFFGRCLKDKIEPWTEDCILDRDVTRSITKAKMLVEEAV